MAGKATSQYGKKLEDGAGGEDHAVLRRMLFARRERLDVSHGTAIKWSVLRV